MLRTGNVVALTLALLAISAPVAAGPADSTDAVAAAFDAPRLDGAWIASGVDLAALSKVMIEPADVTFRRDWISNMNRTAAGTRQLDARDTDRIANDARDSLARTWTDAFRDAGYEIVTAAGPGVLRVAPGIRDLYVNVPDHPVPGRTRSYTETAGSAMLVLEVRDSVSNTLVGRAVDRRDARRTVDPTQTNSITNRFEFESVYRQWARLAVSGLGGPKTTAVALENSP